jgi:hypothetical protein
MCAFVALLLLGCAFGLLAWRAADRAKAEAAAPSGLQDGFVWLNQPGKSSAVVEVHGKPDGNGGFTIDASDLPKGSDPRDHECPEALGGFMSAAFVWTIGPTSGKAFLGIPYRVDITASYVMYETPSGTSIGPVRTPQDWFIAWGGAATLSAHGANPAAAIRCLQTRYPLEMALLARCPAPGVSCSVERIIRPAIWAFGWGAAATLSLVASLALAVWLAILWIVVAGRGRLGNCIGCGYSLTGLRSGDPCPECGRTLK